ncbi:hypothetical protein [Herbaspirillum huttiense]|uniref:hypothetical protein n=1 Tax=Herbaspirillum huttiense TaxID=863372 RepID=UPI0039AEA485
MQEGWLARVVAHWQVPPRQTTWQHGSLVIKLRWREIVTQSGNTRCHIDIYNRKAVQTPSQIGGTSWPNASPRHPPAKIATIKVVQWAEDVDALATLCCAADLF